MFFGNIYGYVWIHQFKNGGVFWFSFSWFGPVLNDSGTGSKRYKFSIYLIVGQIICPMQVKLVCVSFV